MSDDDRPGQIIARGIADGTAEEIAKERTRLEQERARADAAEAALAEERQRMNDRLDGWADGRAYLEAQRASESAEQKARIAEVFASRWN